MTFGDIALELDKLGVSEGLQGDARQILKLAATFTTKPAIETENENHGAESDEFVYFRWEKGSKNVTLQIQNTFSTMYQGGTKFLLWRGTPLERHRGFTIKSGKTYAEIENPNEYDFMAARLWLGEDLNA